MIRCLKGLFRHNPRLVFRTFSENKPQLTRKDNIYTISIIGKANVGKSTLFNRIMGFQAALVDKTPGLTRDRKELITYNILGIPIRFVDTAGWESPNKKPHKEKLKHNDGTKEKALIELMIQQTHLALFVVDSRNGIEEEDQFLAQWLHTRMRLGRNVGVKVEDIPKTLEERKKEFEKMVEEGKELIPGTNLLRVSKRKLSQKFKELERKSKQIKDLLLTENADDVKVPTVLLVANKSEDGTKGDIEENSGVLNLGSPIFVSAEHGDGLVFISRGKTKKI